ncbi:molybdopterin-dependent oxidoreductase [Virgibacillus sp. NKC19-3]|uniref:molybdopterin-dependent oxidoreductase n=1 Tax=Virgibacillus saliphilus TaxID=2831674 RepID=UPI001C9B9448|nr:molybdopterin-dependent oxidoreductase [Virgibacillus sp. NKC19-3]MBY7142062.1 molybdopterin-dependent oxidoreductase [Virgibacillus sp. NKC19-3]
MNISRRDFIKAGVVGSTALGLSGSMVSHKWLQAASDNNVPNEVEKFTYHTPNCGGRCAFICTVRDGKLSLIEPNTWADNRFSTICLRGISEIERVYSPDRIQTPLKRIGKRGEGKFVPISWDEALTTIADNLQPLINQHGGKSILVSMSSGVEHNYKFLSTLLGTQWVIEQGIDVGLSNGLFKCLGGDDVYTYMQNEITDWVNSSTILILGSNILETTITDSKFFFEAKDAGAKIITIDPVYTTTASKSDQWISIKPGSDVSLLLAMISLIIENEWYQADYLVANTSASFLIREDNGQLLRLNESEEEDVEKNPQLVWDEKSESAKPFNEEGIKPALEGAFTVDDVEVKTVFTALKENQKPYTLSWAAKMTNIDEDVIYELTKDYATRGPAVLGWGFGGLDKLTNADIAGHAGGILGSLTGNFGRVGGGVGAVTHHASAWGAELNAWPIPAEFQETPLEVPTSDFREGKGSVKAVINVGNTLQQHFANMNKTEEWIDSLDFLVTIDPFHNSSANYADIVLPASTAFESEYDIVNMQINRSHVLLAEKVIEPLYESKSDFQIEKELLAKFGLDKHHPETPEEWIETQLDSDDPHLDGINVQTLKDNNFIMRLNVPTEPYRGYMDQIYDTPTGKIELYSENFLDFEQALPTYENPNEIYDDNPLMEKYPLQFIQSRSRYHVHSQFTNVNWVQQLDEGPTIEINPTDAKTRGLKKGDTVEVFNDRGSMKAECKLTEAMRPGVVRMHEGWWSKHMIDGNLQNLTNDVFMERQYGLKNGPVIPYNDTLVEVNKV